MFSEMAKWDPNAWGSTLFSTSCQLSHQTNGYFFSDTSELIVEQSVIP